MVQVLLVNTKKLVCMIAQVQVIYQNIFHKNISYLSLVLYTVQILSKSIKSFMDRQEWGIQQKELYFKLDSAIKIDCWH